MISVVKKVPVETKFLKEVIRDLSCDDPEARRKALDAVMTFAWYPGWKPAEFIVLGDFRPSLAG